MENVLRKNLCAINNMTSSPRLLDDAMSVPGSPHAPENTVAADRLLIPAIVHKTQSLRQPIQALRCEEIVKHLHARCQPKPPRETTVDEGISWQNIPAITESIS
ncbi:hypothetical protein L6164_034678 [Bauhinia variegata]|uniref:Uncharacterized protein n=1 Tax=Bauhinia variegata TaxID=167791 RepID=A0ACB9KVV9_BAUVA|nr:hypothetical protein L6164_034678 [Bauhinia variegata]